MSVSAAAASDFNLDHLAHLARLELTADEKARFAAQLGDVINYISLLKEVEVSGVEATAHAYPLFNVLADDVVQPALSVEAALRNAPERRDNMIVVPKVVD
jgi:aspartyl-tRNA(Asn)/glutamyl-tRNA(Gln) amidotransferase subunit C